MTTDCIHEWEFIKNDYAGIVNGNGEIKDAYIEIFNCIYCAATRKDYYTYYKSKIFEE